MTFFSRLSSFAYAILWRVSIFFLPWQARWIFSKGEISGFPWEQGTSTLYISWFILFLTVVTGILAYRDRWKEWLLAFPGVLHQTAHAWFSFLPIRFRVVPFFLVPLFLLIPSIFTASVTATAFWWGQEILLALFIATIVLARVPFMSLAKWFVIMLLPQACLAIFQYLDQDVFASSILGIAEQHPWIRGTSVVEHGLYRVLRAYGGFPHPNILGGWLAVGITLLPFLFVRAKTAVGRIGLNLGAAFFMTALVFSYGRGAWIAAFVGFVFAWLVEYFNGKSDAIDRLRLITLAIILGLSFGLAAGTQWDHVVTRLHPSEYQLERFSLETRSNALQDGRDALGLRQINGWGPGANLIGINEVKSQDSARMLIAPEPPHVAPFVALLDFGFLGVIALLPFLYVFFRRSFFSSNLRFRRWEKKISFIDPLFLVLLVLSATDHYLWTLWAGQSLFWVIVALVVMKKDGESEVESRESEVESES